MTMERWNTKTLPGGQTVIYQYKTSWGKKYWDFGAGYFSPKELALEAATKLGRLRVLGEKVA
jgi:hypothetical protein